VRPPNVYPFDQEKVRDHFLLDLLGKPMSREFCLWLSRRANAVMAECYDHPTEQHLLHGWTGTQWRIFSEKIASISVLALHFTDIEDLVYAKMRFT
jgi:hypothetical protein